MKVLYKKIRIGPVAFIDHKNTRNFHQAGLHCLNFISRFRYHYNNRCISQPCNFHFTLSYTNRLNDDIVKWAGIEQAGNFKYGRVQTRQVIPG